MQKVSLETGFCILELICATLIFIFGLEVVKVPTVFVLSVNVITPMSEKLLHSVFPVKCDLLKGVNDYHMMHIYTEQRQTGQISRNIKQCVCP